ncbi:MAG: hypothetical protein NVSMB29_12340 [Candidatus Dormibacteria bacterium]
MTTTRRRVGERAVGMVEFAIVGPLVLLLVFGLVDLSRAAFSLTTVSDAARQGARQAVANAPVSDNSFGGYSGQRCSGTAFTYSVSSDQGCLTDAGVMATVRSVLGPAIAAAQVSQQSSCTVGPPLGQAYVCITPTESGGRPGGAPANCGAAGGAGNPLPSPGALGGRSNEQANLTYKGCFLVEVTVVAAYQPLTPLASNVIGNSIQLRSSTTMIAEY